MVRTLIISAIAALAITGAKADMNTLISKSSPHSVAETADKFVAAVKGAGATVFAVVDHAKGAMSVDMKLAPAVVVIFGNPKLGTPPMQINAQIGLDLPLKVLIREQGGATVIEYLDPAALKDRYKIEGAEKTFKMMTGALDKLTSKAAMK